MVDEFLFIEGKVKAGDLDLGRRIKGLNRYTDDCSALDMDRFRKLPGTYTHPVLTLELSQENEDLRQATVVDMHYAS